MMRECGGTLIGDSEEAVGEKQGCVFIVRGRKPRVLLKFEVVDDFAHLGMWVSAKVGDSKQRWVEDPENIKWRDVARQICFGGSPLRFQFPGVHFSTDRSSALLHCSIASLAKGEITDEMLEQDRLQWQRLEVEDVQRARDNLFQWRLEALQNGKRPCGCGWCNCSDFDKAVDVASGRLCRCGHSVFEHMGKKFDAATLLGAVFGQR